MFSLLPGEGRNHSNGMPATGGGGPASSGAIFRKERVPQAPGRRGQNLHRFQSLQESAADGSIRVFVEFLQRARPDGDWELLPLSQQGLLLQKQLQGNGLGDVSDDRGTLQSLLPRNLQLRLRFPQTESLSRGEPPNQGVSQIVANKALFGVFRALKAGHRALSPGNSRRRVPEDDHEGQMKPLDKN